MTEMLPLRDLVRRCKEETGRYRRGEPYSERYCLELFRRAIVQRDDEAWAATYEQYADMVRRWLGPSHDGDDEPVARTFERFWQAVDGAKFARFGSLSAVLQYLKMCAHATRIDRMRAARSSGREEPLDDMPEVVGYDDVEDPVLRRVDAADLWATVQSALGDERERLVIYLSYAIGLAPREICRRHGTEFPDVTDVYRLKRSALDRLRRAAEVRAFR